MTEFEQMLRAMFSSIWDCEIDHPIFCDTVGELMGAVIKAYEKCKSYAEVHKEETTGDLISREEAIDLAYDCEDEFGKDVAFRFAYYLRHLPSAQPEIVHCKDCKFSNEDIFDRGLYCEHEGALFDVEDNHYCKWAKRR